MAEPLLEARGCSFRYADGGFNLSETSLQVCSGEVLGIVGPNGSGKSTLLRLMGGILKPQAGDVLLEGRSLHSIGRRELARRLAFLPQNLETSFHFNVRQVVAMGRYPYQGPFGFLSRRDIEVVDRVLRETETEQFAGRIFATLSGGEKQRVLVAAVLAQEPAVMLLDEPTAALDIHHCAEVVDMLWRLSRTGIGVAMVTHDLNTASQFCDRLVLLGGGRMICSGTPDDVLQEGVLSDAYAAPIRVLQNPLTRTPFVTLLGKAAHDAG